MSRRRSYLHSAACVDLKDGAYRLGHAKATAIDGRILIERAGSWDQRQELKLEASPKRLTSAWV